nr:hypothetical protein [Cytophagales bacterium]
MFGFSHFFSSFPLNFNTAVLSILQLFKESAEFVTEDVLSKLGKQEVTGNAFSQAGYKNLWQFFSDLCAISSEDYDTFSNTRGKDTGYSPPMKVRLICRHSSSTLKLSFSGIFRNNLLILETVIPEKNLLDRLSLDFDTSAFTISYTKNLGSQIVKIQKGGDRLR